MTLRCFSYGGGVQSTAALILAARGEIDFPVFVFANVGADSEHPATLRFVHEVAMPYAAAHGVELVEVYKTVRGQPESLLGRIRRCERSLPLPVRMSNGAPGRRTCTADFKIRVVAKWQRSRGASATDPALTALGISTDEFHRARTDSGIAWQVLSYPLIDLGLDREACVRIIESAGLPVPPKSACWFCPYHRRAEWERMRREEPDLFWRAVALEQLLNARRKKLGRDQVYFHSSAKPLAEAVKGPEDASGLLAEPPWQDVEMCESGYCMV